jgi:hypothetical protein
MTNQFLDKILKNHNVYFLQNVIKGGEGLEDNPQQELAKPASYVLSKIKNAPANAIYSARTGLKTAVNYASGTSTDKVKTEELSEKITKSFQKAFDIIKLKEQLTEIDLQKIAKLVIEKPVNLNFGGGFLVFGPDLKITSMIHIYNKDNEPFYFEKEFNSAIEKNVINEGVKSDKKYTLKQNVKSITEKINNKPKTS